MDLMSQQRQELKNKYYYHLHIAFDYTLLSCGLKFFLFILLSLLFIILHSLYSVITNLTYVIRQSHSLFLFVFLVSHVTLFVGHLLLFRIVMASMLAVWFL